MTTQGQPDLPAGGGRVFTVRAFLLGCLLTAFLGIALPWIVLSTHGLHAYFDYIPMDRDEDLL